METLSGALIAVSHLLSDWVTHEWFVVNIKNVEFWLKLAKQK